MAELDLGLINVIAELDHYGVPWEPAGGDGSEIRCRCPAESHQDEHPSCQINVDKRLFKCMVPTCGVRGDFITFLALVVNSPRRVVIDMLSERYDFDRSRTVDPEVVERWHEAIWSCAPMLKELRDRGVTDEDVREHRLGYDRNRVTIPIYNEHGTCVNVRKYLPGAPGADKMKNMRGHGDVRLYPIEQLKYDTVVVTGGEMKAIVGARRLNPLGIGCLTATAGEGNWEPEFSKALRGKRVFVCMDVDPEGRAAADKVAARTKGDARWIGTIDLPLDLDKYPKGDLNDWFGPERRSAEEFVSLMETCPEWSPPATPSALPDGETRYLHLSEITDAVNTKQRIKVSAVVTQKDENPYLVPKRVQCDCSRNAEFCNICPVFARTPDEKGTVDLTVHPQSAAMLSMIDASKKQLRDATREGLDIPPCKVVHFETKEWYNVEDLRLTPQLEIGSRQRDNVMRSAYYVGGSLESNQSYEFDGRVYPHPTDQHAVMVASEARPTKDTLESFEPTDLELEELSVFQPEQWTEDGVAAKLDDLYEDFESNVTFIYQRREMHLVMDLAWHSCLLLDFDGRKVKGWAEVLVIGDSSQGKSETSSHMMDHYGLGEKFECKNATVSGVMGGLEKSGDRFFVKWGVIPTHDRRLVVLEELKGMPIEVISKLTDMRSSGVAEINKIEKRRSHARTRLIAVTNPRSGQPLSAYNFGCEAVKELIGNLEDVRRFDLAYLVTSDQVDSKTLNVLMQSRPKVPHRHTAERCRRLVLWAWTRLPEQVLFTDESTQAIMTASVAFANKFSDALPLVDRGSIRLKLARLSASLACRTFSCANEDRRKVVVRPCHVNYLTRFVDELYSSTRFGYLDFSRSLLAAVTLIDVDVLRKRLLGVPFVKDFAESCLNTSEIELRDICDWCGWESDQGRELLSLLVRKHALVREGNHYRKTSGFIDLLKKMQQSGDLDRAVRPDWVREVDLKREM